LPEALNPTALEAEALYFREESDRVCIREAHLKNTVERLKADKAGLVERLITSTEENLWNAYHAGHVTDGKWTHMHMSDGEDLAQQCGFDPRLAYYSDDAIRAAIPIAARAALDLHGRREVSAWDLRYRRLAEGEIIAATDDVQRDDGSWQRAQYATGEPAPNPSFTSHRVYRRLKDTRHDR